MGNLMQATASILDWMATLFVIGVGVGVLVIALLYVVDVTQTRHTVRRNFPVIGRFRYFFEHLGEFFRQYFFAGDREEMPFNRAQRSWVYRAAKGVDHTIAFGSSLNLKTPGTTVFVNCPYPTLEEDSVPPTPMTIGPYANKPYEAKSFFNISGMSYGALSKPAVLALSKGAKAAGKVRKEGKGYIVQDGDVMLILAST